MSVLPETVAVEVSLLANVHVIGGEQIANMTVRVGGLRSQFQGAVDGQRLGQRLALIIRDPDGDDRVPVEGPYEFAVEHGVVRVASHQRFADTFAGV